MLRWLLVLLTLSNLAYWAWHQPAVAEALGLPSAEAGHEPERLARQLNPELVQVLPEQPAPTVPSPAPRTVSPNTAPPNPPPAATCLQTGPLNDEQLAAATRQLNQAGLRSDRWLDIRRERPGRWAVYMGRYADTEMVQRKLIELRRLRLSPDELVNHAQLSPGITLGKFDTEADARAQLAQLQARGVRTARVVVLLAPVVEHRLRLEDLAPELASRISQLALNPPAARWQPCASAP